MSRTSSMLEQLVVALQGNCGDRFDACRQCGVSLVWLEQWCRDDREVAERIAEAARVGSYQLESAAIKRAVHGVEKGVYFKGIRVDTETVYSDGLLQTLLKGRMAEVYATGGEGGGNVFNGPVQINNMPRASSYDEWLRMREETDRALAARSQEALPAPDVIDAEFVPIPEPNAFEGVGL